MGDLRDLTYLGLFLFGIIYNWFMGLAEQRGWTEGLISLYVAAGSAVTIGGMAILDLEAAGLALLCFFLSGGPMMFGSLARYVQKRENGQDDHRRGDR